MIAYDDQTNTAYNLKTSTQSGKQTGATAATMNRLESQPKRVVFYNDRELEKIEAEEQTAQDPDAVDNLISQEMMNLSAQHRNEIQEEIHGVWCLAVEETPELVKRALESLAVEIDERTPDSRKMAYLQSQKPPKEIPEHQRILKELHQLEPLPQKTYVNDPEFRLRFLRCELFDIRKSAKRMLMFLDMALELFGDYALRRSIRLSDFTKEEIRYMRKGRFQIMPTRDRSGRRVSTIFAEQEEMTCPPVIKAKICLYQSWAVGHNDTETQRRGHVLLVWLDNTFHRKSAAEKLRYRFDNVKSTRITSIHVCSPDTPYYRFRRAIAMMRTSKEDRKRLCIHLGETVEVQYALQGYGIPSEDIPISWTGKIKIKNLVQWMRIRHAVESYDEYQHLSMPPTDIVECPSPKDVLFRKGNSYVSHRGNAMLRATIITLACSEDDVEKRPKKIASDIYDMRLDLQKNSGTTTNSNSNSKASMGESDSYYESNNIAGESGAIGRYLTWNSNKDWWNEMKDREQICSKIEYMVREIRKAYGIVDTTRSRSQKKRSNSGDSPLSSSKQQKDKTNSIDNTNDPQPTLTLSSDTNIFRSRDSSNDSLFADGHKRQKRGGPLDWCNSNTNSAASSDEDANFNNNDDICFGLNFNPCN